MNYSFFQTVEIWSYLFLIFFWGLDIRAEAEDGDTEAETDVEASFVSIDKTFCFVCVSSDFGESVNFGFLALLGPDSSVTVDDAELMLVSFGLFFFFFFIDSLKNNS